MRDYIEKIDCEDDILTIDEFLSYCKEGFLMSDDGATQPYLFLHHNLV